jgi:hypothetical protein
MRYLITRNWVLVLAAAFVVAAGCGPKSDRLPINGAVTLNGVPLDRGSIRFTSTGESLSSAGSSIREGAYSIPQEKGLIPGNYRVQINSADVNAAPILVRNGPDDPGIRTQPERIPADYSVDGKHTIDVTLDGENNFEFAITASPAAK